MKNWINCFPREINGHDHNEIFKAIDNNLNLNRPNVIVANTIKAKVSLENKNEWHHSVLTKKSYEEALESLNKNYENWWKKIKNDVHNWYEISFGLSCLEFVKDFPDMMILTCDVSTSAGLDNSESNFHQIIWKRISEQNLIGIATGLSSENFKVITTNVNFSNIEMLWANQQSGYMKSKVLL